ncbi:MAG TPA: SAM-dependent methyltransferase [Candidatus Polarisedimenticolia bacterium]|nr:SAM-dependent methyltransferase [Candidatus Polarisedimenticolia bacterium]
MSGDAQGPSSPLRDLIVRDIRAHGPIPFARFMELALYHPEHGYYTCGLGGGSGRDYLTSSGVHRAYGLLLARQAEEMWRHLGEPAAFDFVEFGPGEGFFAADFLAEAAHFAPFARGLRYRMVETSPALRARQERRLRALASVPPAGAFPAFSWTTLEELEAEVVSGRRTLGCLFANEVLDAFPVHRVVGTPLGPREIHVGLADEEAHAPQSALVETEGPLGDGLGAWLQAHGVAPLPGQEIDIAPAAEAFVRRAAALLDRGWFLIVDYGHEAAELYRPARRRGTLLAYHRHSTSEDFLAHPGEQDLTSHADFTAATRAAESAGLERLALLSQAHLLLALGALDLFEAEDLRGREALKDLILPDRMGGTFRVLVLRAGGASKDLRGLSRPWRKTAPASPPRESAPSPAAAGAAAIR